MKFDAKCPICHSPFLNNEVMGTTMWRKSCSSRVNHKLEVTYDLKTELIVKFILSDQYNHTFVFYPLDHKICIYKNMTWEFFLKRKIGRADHKVIPYFEPDFSNYHKLLQKLKTYVLFL